jgi:hypothetical protein
MTASPTGLAAAGSGSSTITDRASLPLFSRAILKKSSSPLKLKIPVAASTSGLHPRTPTMTTGSSSVIGRFQARRAHADRCASNSPNSAVSTAEMREIRPRARSVEAM